VAHPIHVAVQAVAVAGEFLIRSNKKSIFSAIVKICRNPKRKGLGGKGIDLGKVKANKG